MSKKALLFISHVMENSSSLTEGAPEAYPEPVPDWYTAHQKWSLGWQMHTYGFGVCYALLSLYCIIVLVHLRRRLRIQQYILIINGILLILSVCRAVYLFLDPYESVGVLPVPLLRVMYGVPYPCLTSSFSLVQMVVMRITKVRMGPQKFHNYRVLAAVITTHFTVVIVIDITVAYKNGLRLLILICQSIFTTWGLVLCFSFVYNGFKVAQFTNEANKALKQLITYWKVKQETLKNGNRKELALHRINKPKIRTDFEERWIAEEGHSSDADCSSESLSFYNEAHLEFTEDALAKIYENRLKKFKKNRANIKDKFGSPSNLRLTPTTNLDLDFSSDSGNIPETPSTYGPVSTEERYLTPNEDMFMVSTQTSSVLDMTQGQGQGQGHGHSHGHFNNRLPQGSLNLHAYINPAFDTYLNGRTKHALRLVPTPHLQMEENQLKDQSDCTTTTLCAIESEDHSHVTLQTQESGYMADTEYSSPKPVKKKGKSSSRRNDLVDIEVDGSPTHEPYPLPASDGTLGLYRIRQGRMLRKVLRVTYLTTLCGFVCCVLQLYAMFGVYGVLSNEIPAEPWPWLVFQSAIR